jgi:hypothetical protein
MKTKLAILSFFLLSPFISLLAQYEPVDVDYQLGDFNHGPALPAASYLLRSGTVPEGVEWIEIDVFRSGNTGESLPLAVTTWKKIKTDGSGSFRVPLNYKLRGSSEFSFRLRYFRPISLAEQNALKKALKEAVGVYLRQATEVKRDELRLSRSTGAMLSDLNSLLTEGLSFYRSRSDQPFGGFSEVVVQTLDALDGKPISEGRDQLIQSSLLPIFAEIDQFIQGDWLILIDTRKVQDYPTENTRSALSINLGYGGVYLDGGIDDLSYGVSPYVGLSFPLANRAYASRLLSNTSLSLGVFINNFENRDMETISGPIFGRPYYLGLGYSFFRFVRLNVGATALEKVGTSNVGGGSASFNVGEIQIAPFIGLSAEIDLWLGLKK